MKDHEKRFQERIRSVRDACNAVENAASRFEGAVRNAWGTMDKSASEYGTRMAQTIQESARKLSRQQASSSYEDAEKFHKNAIEALNTIIKTVRRYVPKLRRGLRVEMAALNVALGRLESTIKSLGSALDQSPGNKIELIIREITHLTQIRAELMSLKSEAVEGTKSLAVIATREQEVLAEAKRFESNDSVAELTRYENSLRSKEQEISEFLQPIFKPLTKLERNESISKNQTVDLGKLRSLVDRPAETVTSEQPFTLIQLLTQLDEALKHGRLEIEERRRRKAEETIQLAKQGAIERLREDYLTLQANVQETLRQLKAAGLLEKKDEIEQRQAALREQKEHITRQNVELDRRLDSVTSSMIKQKQSIEREIKQVTSTGLEIQID